MTQGQKEYVALLKKIAGDLGFDVSRAGRKTLEYMIATSGHHVPSFREFIAASRTSAVRKGNRFRFASIVANRRHQTHCAYGHPFTPENTRLNSRGWRKCLACEKARRLSRRKN